MVKTTRQLPVQFTYEERVGLLEGLQEQLQLYRAIESEKEGALEKFNENLKEVWGEIGRLSSLLEAGEEIREVEVEIRPNYAEGTIEEIRLDNSGRVSARAMEPSERQMPLPEEA